MRKLGFAFALAAGLGLAAASFGSAQAAVAGPSGQLGAAAGSLSAVEKTAFVYRGRTHCWYDRGWNGPGWYWCGYRDRRGRGWGGPRGWNNWVWAPSVRVAPGVRVVAPTVVVPGRRCRWVRERIVRPNGVVVVRRVKVCR